jgi:hypothetical protein
MKNKKNQKETVFDEEFFPNWHIFIFLSIINFLIAFLASQFIFTRDFYYTIFSDKMELSRIDKYVDLVDRFSFYSLLLLPLFLFLKFSVIAFILQIPLLFRYIEISFRYLFRLVMLASLALTLGQVVHFLTIYLTSAKNVSASLFKILPLSLATCINPEEYSSNAIVILNQFSIFDILWGAVLYIGLIKTCKIKTLDAIILILCVWTFLLLVQWLVLFFLENFQ